MQSRNKSLRYILIVAFMVAIFATAMGSLAMAAGDITAPVVTSVTPANGSTMYTNGSSTIYYQLDNTTPLVIKADYSDEVGGSGVDVNSVMVHLDGSNMLDNCPVQTDAHVECVATAADLFPGTHPLDIYVADVDGNLTVNHTTVIVALDNQAPTYSNLLPANGSTIHTSQLNSTGINDMSALRFDYDLTDAAPSSGYSPMTHINDSVPPGVSGAMISNTSCVKTPATNPTHYSCQANRASLLHLGDNTLSVLLKDKVGNTSTNYTDSSSLNHYTVVDDVAPAVSGLTADTTTISANYSDPLPTGALSANLASGINAGTAMVHVDGTMIMMGCTTTGTGISCPTPSGLSVGTHAIKVMVDDNAGNMGTGSGSFSVTVPTAESVFLAKWNALVGAPGNSMGAATATTGGMYKNYVNGRLIWNQSNDTVYWVHGAILIKYDQLGGETSDLGLPLIDEMDVTGVTGARKSEFTGGTVYWGP
ncbi:MAG: hypothetical protein JJD96_04720, partial [Thermoleophilia bacterium]|nr:hypothetical protein [Thermoleophilia bacterium]